MLISWLEGFADPA